MKGCPQKSMHLHVCPKLTLMSAHVLCVCLYIVQVDHPRCPDLQDTVSTRGACKDFLSWIWRWKSMFSLVQLEDGKNLSCLCFDCIDALTILMVSMKLVKRCLFF